MFCMKILPKFHEKTLSRSGGIKFFVQGGGCTCALCPTFMDEVLSE